MTGFSQEDERDAIDKVRKRRTNKRQLKALFVGETDSAQLTRVAGQTRQQRTDDFGLKVVKLHVLSFSLISFPNVLAWNT